MQGKESDTVSSLSFKQVQQLLKSNMMHDIYSLDDKKITNILVVGSIQNFQINDSKKHTVYANDGFCVLSFIIDSNKIQDYSIGCYYLFMCQIKQFKDARFLCCNFCEQILDSNNLTRQLVKIIYEATKRRKNFQPKIRKPFSQILIQPKIPSDQAQLNSIQQSIMAIMKLYETVPFNILKSEFSNKFLEEDLIKALAELKDKKLIANRPGSTLTFILC